MRDGLKERKVKCIEAMGSRLVKGQVYTVHEEEKPKVVIKEGAWKGYTQDDPNAPTLYSVSIDGDTLEHVPAEKFEILPMKQVKYKGGWGSPHFACCYGEIHAPLQKDGVYDVVAVHQLQTLGLPEHVYDLMCNGTVVEHANAAHFATI